MKSKKALLDNVIGLAVGIILLGVIATIGVVLLGNFASTNADCAAGYAYNETLDSCYKEYCIDGTLLNTTYSIYSETPCLNTTRNITCCFTSANYSISTATAATSAAAKSAHYAQSYTGSDATGSLLTWLPVIIPAVIGIGIIGYFMSLRRKGQGY